MVELFDKYSAGCKEQFKSAIFEAKSLKSSLCFESSSFLRSVVWKKQCWIEKCPHETKMSES